MIDFVMEKIMTVFMCILMIFIIILIPLIFIGGFIQANKDSKNLGKYIEGIKVAKPALILGGIYYIVIPIISTFFADRFLFIDRYSI